MAEEPATAKQRARPLILLLLVALVIFSSLYFDLGAQLESAQEWIAGLGRWGPFAFIALYALLTMLAVPGSVLTLAAGALFGLVWGVAYTFVAALLGSCGAFLIARYLARDWIQSRVAGDPRLAQIDSALGKEGLKIMILLRLSPVFPFNFLNFALGLTGVRFVDYVMAGFAMIPGTLLFVYYGYVAGNVVKLSVPTTAERNLEYYAFMTVGLMATVAVTAVITRIAKNALRQASANSVEPTGETIDETDGDRPA